ncbi:MAG: hypothetical protein MUC48_17270 [Leptolyngbya sp. Prado105]|jgi:hypothetical protein|nr:hypothetical protein [Leptolyngbya sp. Prado105]
MRDHGCGTLLVCWSQVQMLLRICDRLYREGKHLHYNAWDIHPLLCHAVLSDWNLIPLHCT